MAKRTAKKSTKKTTRKKSARKSAPAAAVEAKIPDALRVPPPLPPEQILGHAAPLDQLRAVLRSGRLHHAWLFHGPVGVGKRTVAQTFAAALLDPEAGQGLIDPDPLGVDPESPIQRTLAAGTHPDLHLIRKELAAFSREDSVRRSKQRTISVHVIREFLIEPAERSASATERGAASKVFIVDEAELLGVGAGGGAAQNALLKTLEEPPEGTVIILVTSSEDRLLPTIRSRCNRIAFAPLTDDAVRTWLDRHRERLGIPPAHEPWLIAHAAGSPGRLERAVEWGLHDWHEALEPMLARTDRGQLPATLGATMASLVDGFAKAWTDAGTKLGESRSKEAANVAGARELLAMLAERARRRITANPTDLRPVRDIAAIERAERELGSNVQLTAVMDHLAAEIAAPPGEPAWLLPTV